jgi:hypothetical protein
MKPPGPHLSVVPEPGDDDPELERYLGAARELAEPDAQSRARVARALNAALPPAAPLPAFGTNATSSSSAGSSSAALSSLRAAAAARLYAPWLAVGAIVIGGLGFGLGLTVGRTEPTAPATAAQPARPPLETSSALEGVSVTPPSPRADDVANARTPPPPPEAGPDEARPTATPPLEATSTPKRKAPSAPRGKPLSASAAAQAVPRATLGGAPEARPPGALDFRQALERLRRARTQLEQGHATASLLLLSELDREAGELLFEEREATRVLALCATGETSAARATAERLAQRSPRSIYLRRLASSCIDESAAAPDVPAIGGGADVRSR